MACNSCGNKSGFSGSCNSCSKVPDINTETALETIKNGDENFCFNEVTDGICDNLQNDKGIHPFNGKNNTDCKDLHALNTYLNGNLWNSLKTLDFCDINAFRCWLYNLVSNSWNMTKALVCAICGLWKKVHELEAKNKFIPYFRRINRVGTGIWGEPSHITNFNKTKIIGRNGPAGAWEEYVTIEGQASLITSALAAGATMELTLDGTLFTDDDYIPQVVLPVIFANIGRGFQTYSAILMYQSTTDKWFVKNTSGVEIPLDNGFRFSLTYQQGNVTPGEVA